MREFVGAALCVVSWTAAAVGQDADSVQRLQRQMRDAERNSVLEFQREGTLEERLYLGWDAALRFTVASIDDERSESHLLRRSDARVQMQAELDGRHRALVRLRFQYDDWNKGDDFDGRGDEFEPQIAERFWYEFQHGDPGASLRLRGGKQYVHWNSGLALSNTMHAGSFEAEWGRFGVQGFAGRTPSLTVDFDGSRPGFNRHTHREYAGLRLEWDGGDHHPFVSAMGQRDHNDRDTQTFVDLSGVVFPTRFENDSQYFSAGCWGDLGSGWTYDSELCFQNGRNLSSPRDEAGNAITQTREDISAWAASLSLARVLGDVRDTRLEAQLMAGSGDSDRLDATDTFGGNQSGTTDRSFQSLGYAPTGLALSPELANLGALRLGLSTRPFATHQSRLRGLHLSVDGFLFGKLRTDAPLDVATTDDRFVGGELDLAASWELSDNLRLDLRGGIFFPGAAMPRGQDGSREVLLMGLTYAF